MSKPVVVVNKYIGEETFKDDFLKIIKKDNKLYYTFRGLERIPKSKRLSTILQYFNGEVRLMPKEAIIDLFEIAFEIVRGKKTYRDIKFIDRLKNSNRDEVMISYWNMILSEEGLGFIK